MHLRSTSIIKIIVKKWLYLLNVLFAFDGTFKIEKSNTLTEPLVRKVSPNYFSQNLKGPNVSEDTNVTLLPKRKLFFLNMANNHNLMFCVTELPCNDKFVLDVVLLSLLNCVPYILKTCSRAVRAYVLTCLACLRVHEPTALRVHLPTCLTCSHANVPCVLKCSRVLRAYVLTCQRVLRAYALACQRALHTHVLMPLTCPRANVPSVTRIHKRHISSVTRIHI